MILDEIEASIRSPAKPGEKEHPMKTMKSWFLILLVLLLGLMALTALAESGQAPVIKVDINPDSVAVGQPVTATVHITGGSRPMETVGRFYVLEGELEHMVAFYSDFQDGATFTYIPRFGQSIYFDVSVNSGGLEVGGHSKKVTITEAPEVEPIKIVLEFDKDSVAVNQEVTLAAKVEGGAGDYKNTVSWLIKRDGGWRMVEEDIPLNEDGTATYTPKDGDALEAFVRVRDGAGRNVTESKEIPITGGGLIKELAVSISMNVRGVDVGEPVTATVTIENAVGSFSAWGHWNIYENGKDYPIWVDQFTENGKTITFTPAWGEHLSLTIYADDESSQHDREDSGKVTIHGAEAVEKFEASLSLNQQVASINRPVTGTLVIKGGVPPYDVNANWVVRSGVVEHEYAAFINPENGQTSHTPASGQSLYLYTWVTDAMGRQVYVETERIDIKHFPLTGLTLPEQLNLKVGDSQGLPLGFEPENASDIEVVWASDKPEIAQVDEAGKVTAKALGSALITATSTKNKNIKASCRVEVMVLAQGLKISAPGNAVDVQGSLQMTAVITPEDASIQEVQWASSDDTLATVDEKGLVKGLAPGLVKITAATKDGTGLADSFTLSVVQKVTSLSLKEGPHSLALPGEMQLKALVAPENASNQALSWISSNEAIATVDQSGLVKGLAPGRVTIVVTAQDGSGKAASRELLLYALLRGDADGSGVVDLGDALCLIDYLVLGSPCPAMDNADTDGSGDAPHLGDLIFIVNQLLK